MPEKPATAPTAAFAWLSPGISYPDFLERDGDNPHVEWVDGAVVPMSPVSKEHADLGGWLASLLRHFAEAHDLGKVLCEPFQMKTGPNLPGRAPDVLFVAKAQLSRLQRLHLDGPADLVVEIISPGSRALDRKQKFLEYQEGGVHEYWLLDPERQEAEFYQRGADTLFHKAALSPGGVYQSVVMRGLWVRVNWLWQQPLPPLLHVLKDWNLV